MIRPYVSIFPWDILDDLPGVLDHLHGEIGVHGITLCAAGPSVLQLRTATDPWAVFHTRGGLLFHARDELYRDTRCKPVEAGWVKGRDPLKRITDAAHERGLEVRAMVSAATTGMLAERHPEFACRNAFDAESQHSLCLAHPEVKAYLVALLRDLGSDRALSGIVLEDFVIRWMEADAPTLRAPFPLGPAARSLLAICFCAACADASGVDAAAARRSVQEHLKRVLHRGLTDGGLAALCADDPTLTAYLRWRNHELDALLVRLVQASACEVILARPDVAGEAGLNERDWSIPAGVISTLSAFDERPPTCPNARRQEIRISDEFLQTAPGADLVAFLPHAVSRGIGEIHLGNFGLMSAENRTAIKQAIRFARRSS